MAQRLVLGTAQVGMPYGIANKTGQPDQAMATSIVREAWECGIRQFDTAQAYGDSEKVLGKALYELGISSKAKIITKFDPDVDHLNAKAMSRSLDQSLQRLGAQTLYGIMLHREEMLSLWNGGLSKILRDFVFAKKVKQIGISGYTPERVIQALNTEGIDMVQLPTNILDRRFENARVFELAIKRKKQIYIRSVFLQGLLLMNPEEIPEKMTFAKSVIEKLEYLSKKCSVSQREAALGYIKESVPHVKVIFGADIPSHVRENCSSWGIKLPQSFISMAKDLFSDVNERILNPVLWPKST